MYNTEVGWDNLRTYYLNPATRISQNTPKCPLYYSRLERNLKKGTKLCPFSTIFHNKAQSTYFLHQHDILYSSSSVSHFKLSFSHTWKLSTENQKYYDCMLSIMILWNKDIGRLFGFVKCPLRSNLQYKHYPYPQYLSLNTNSALVWAEYFTTVDLWL